MFIFVWQDHLVTRWATSLQISSLVVWKVGCLWLDGNGCTFVQEVSQHQFFILIGRAKLTGCYSKVISFVQTKGMIPVQTFLLSERLRKLMKTCSRKAFPINSSGRSLRARIVLFEVLSGVRKRALSLSSVGSNSWVVVVGWRSCVCLMFLRRFLCDGERDNKQLTRINASKQIFLVVGETHGWRCFGNKGRQMTRLETRTKESNICASIMDKQTILIT